MAGSISFEYTQQDLARASRQNYLKRLRSPKTLARNALVLGIFAVFAWVVHYRECGCVVYAFKSSAIATAWLALIILVVLTLCFFQIGAAAKKLLRDNKTLQGVVDMRWSDTAIEMQSPVFKSEMSWEAYSSWSRTKTGYLLFLGDVLFHLIPYRVLDDTSDKDLLRILSGSQLVER